MSTVSQTVIFLHTGLLHTVPLMNESKS